MSRFMLVQYAGPGAVPVTPASLGADVDFIRIDWHSPDSPHKARERDTKWTQVARLDELWRDIQSYGLVGFIDDDIIPSGCTWHDIFTAAERTGLEVTMPALTIDSYISWPITAVNPRYVYRETNFVEILTTLMTPTCAKLWREAFGGDIVVGMETLWCMGGATCGIVDATPVKHLRPVRFKEHCVRLGVDPIVESRRFCDKWGTKMLGATKMLRGHTEWPHERA
jgi:hypothetical protein